MTFQSQQELPAQNYSDAVAMTIGRKSRLPSHALVWVLLTGLWDRGPRSRAQICQY